LTVLPGEIWLADRGEETPRPVFVLSDARFHRLAERAVIAPVLASTPDHPRPWHVRLPDGRAIAVNLLGTTALDRLLERVGAPGIEPLRLARRAVHAITG
jgi:mRNA-degrading endonuclease toxin of MazEF toxin-antitoxin module